MHLMLYDMEIMHQKNQNNPWSPLGDIQLLMLGYKGQFRLGPSKHICLLNKKQSSYPIYIIRFLFEEIVIIRDFFRRVQSYYIKKAVFLKWPKVAENGLQSKNVTSLTPPFTPPKWGSR